MLFFFSNKKEKEKKTCSMNFLEVTFFVFFLFWLHWELKLTRRHSHTHVLTT